MKQVEIKYELDANYIFNGRRAMIFSQSEMINWNTAYYCCVNKKVNGIKCKARKILKDRNFEMLNQKENIMHYGDKCSLENLEKNMFYKNKTNSIRSKIRDFFI